MCDLSLDPNQPVTTTHDLLDCDVHPFLWAVHYSTVVDPVHHSTVVDPITYSMRSSTSKKGSSFEKVGTSNEAVRMGRIMKRDETKQVTRRAFVSWRSVCVVSCLSNMTNIFCHIRKIFDFKSHSSFRFRFRYVYFPLEVVSIFLIKYKNWLQSRIKYNWCWNIVSSQETTYRSLSLLSVKIWKIIFRVFYQD